jgi:hypothetical protein
MPISFDQAEIFVSIASYRDPDCKNTIDDLFAKAACPERLTVAVCLQVAPGADDDCLLTRQMHTYGARLRILQVHASDSRGCSWARSQVQTLFQDEDYFFQIDSHMRFAQDWDRRLIAMHAQCDAGKAILSTYPMPFTPPDGYAKEQIVTIIPKGFNGKGILITHSRSVLPKHAPAQPERCPFIAGGLIFAPGAVVREAPYDPYLYFNGEEICIAVRFWTHGWDIFTPNQALAWHDYGRQPERLRHWEDHIDWRALNQASFQRVAYLLEGKPVESELALQEIERYRLGTARSLAEYQAFSGLDFARKTWHGNPFPVPAPASEAEQPAVQWRIPQGWHKPAPPGQNSVR